MTPPPPPPLLLPSDLESLLPAPHELTPLSQSLIPPHLASAFLLPSPPPSASSPPHHLFHAYPHPFVAPEPDSEPPSLPSSSSTTPPPPNLHASSWSVASGAAPDHSSPPPPPVPYDPDSAADPSGYLALNHSGGSDSNAAGWRGGKTASGKRMMPPMEMELEEADSCGGGGGENSGGGGDAAAARTLKRPRLVWTPQLHKRFVEAVGHLGIKSAVPKTIMQLMNVEGLTRENVASHLQKYRLYLKRMQGGGGGGGGGAHAAGEGASASDQLFASTPVPPSLVAAAHFLSAAGHAADDIPIPIPAPRTAHISAASPFLHSSFDPHHHHQSLYPGFLRPPPPHHHHPFLSADPHDCSLIDAQAQPPPPPPPPSHKQVLTLFPSTGS